MVRQDVKDLGKLTPPEREKWQYGCGKQIPVDSPFHSDAIQFKYHKFDREEKEERRKYLKQEKGNYHKHTSLTEEFYLVLRGEITVLIDGKPTSLSSRQMVGIPNQVCHMVTKVSLPVEFIVFRAPPSSDNDKLLCKE